MPPSQVVCGTQAGPLLLFKWNHWTAPYTSYKGHPESVDCMVQFNDDIIITGSSDGIIRYVSEFMWKFVSKTFYSFIRLVHIIPHRIMGIIGQHPNEMPVERFDS